MENLFQCAETYGITVEYRRLPDNLSVSVEIGDSCFIGMDYSLLNSQANEKVCLAHELGHCVTGSFYNPYTKLDIRSKHEHRANRWAFEHVLPYDRLMAAVKMGFTEVWQLAELFELPEEFTARAITYYQEKHVSIA